jgi:hypothetical protein
MKAAHFTPLLLALAGCNLIPPYMEREFTISYRASISQKNGTENCEDHATMKLSPTVTNHQVIDLMMARLGDRSAPKLRANVVLELNAYIAGRELQALLPWFLIKATEFTFPKDAIFSPLPDDFLRELEDDQPAVYIDGAWMNQMKKAPLDDMNFDGGGPSDAYTLIGEEIYIAPKAPSDLTVRFRYFAATVEILDNDQPVTNLWLKYAQNLVTFGALHTIAAYQIQDPNMAALFSSEEQRALDGLWRANEARQHTNADYMIED